MAYKDAQDALDEGEPDPEQMCTQPPPYHRPKAVHALCCRGPGFPILVLSPTAQPPFKCSHGCSHSRPTSHAQPSRPALTSFLPAICWLLTREPPPAPPPAAPAGQGPTAAVLLASTAERKGPCAPLAAGVAAAGVRRAALQPRADRARGCPPDISLSPAGRASCRDLVSGFLLTPNPS